MKAEYFQCKTCGYEDYDIDVPFQRQVANGAICACPECGAENLVDEEEEE